MKIDYSKYKQDCVDFLEQLIQTPSVNGRENEQEIVELIRKEAEKLELPYEVFEAEKGRPNIFIGKEFTGDKELLLVAHTDTVPEGDIAKWKYPPFGAVTDDNKLYGRGALDCKGGIALSLYTLKILKDTNNLDKAKFIGSADEESGADSDIGIKYLLEKGLRAKGAVYAYGGGTINKDHITVGHRGVIRLWVTCKGESAHSGSKDWQDRKKGASAISSISQLIERLKDFSVEGESDYFSGYKFTLTPTLIEGGSGESMVPDTAKVLLDIRTLPEHDNDEIIQQIIKVANTLEEDKISFEVTVKNNVPGALTRESETIVSKARNLMREIYDVSGDILPKGSGPANESYMFIKAGIPTIVGFGPEGEGFHSKNEYADLGSIEHSLEFLTRLSLNL